MQKASCDHVLSDVFSSVKVATYAWNVIYSRPAVLLYSLAYSYTFSVLIVFFVFCFLFFSSDLNWWMSCDTWGHGNVRLWEH